MIVYTMSLKIIQDKILEIYPELLKIGSEFTMRFRKSAKSRLSGKPITFKKIDSFRYNNNKFFITYGSRKGTLKDLTYCIFLQLDNEKGGREYYQILLKGFVYKITHHFIERFIERTKCPKEEFLVYFSKEMSLRNSVSLSKDYDFLNTLSGGLVVIYNHNTLVTYINDLNKTKSLIQEKNSDFMSSLDKYIKENNLNYDNITVIKNEKN